RSVPGISRTIYDRDAGRAHPARLGRQLSAVVHHDDVFRYPRPATDAANKLGRPSDVAIMDDDYVVTQLNAREMHSSSLLLQFGKLGRLAGRTRTQRQTSSGVPRRPP